MDEHNRKARIAELQARIDKEKALLRKDNRAADNKRKYLLGGLVIAGLEESQQLRRWVLKAIIDNPPRDAANQKAILPLLKTLAEKEGLSVPALPKPSPRKRKTNSESSRAAESSPHSETGTTSPTAVANQHSHT